jgi:type II secretory pathway component GspD/PulD (secretin)
VSLTRVRGAAVLGAAVLGAAVLGAQAQRPGQMPTLPLTQLDERGSAAELDNRTFSLTFAQPVAVRDVLLLLVRGTSLSVIPAPDVSGMFIGDLKNVTVRQALSLILPPLGLDYAVDAGFIRVFKREPETRLFDINYIATQRAGTSTLGLANTAVVSSTTKTDLFGDLAKGVQSLLSEHATFNVDRKAGLLQVTDFPERLDRIGDYLDAVHDRVHRQVEIEARVVEIELSDPLAAGVDWTVLTAQFNAPASPGAPFTPGPPTVAALARTAVTGLHVTDVARFLTALGTQGKVSTVENPRLLALNNEPAIVHSDAFTLSVTPQIAPDGMIMLSLSPVLKTPTAVESDTLARVANGETVIIAAGTRDREIKERKNVGINGGWFGRATVTTKKRVALLVLLTPKILTSGN